LFHIPFSEFQSLAKTNIFEITVGDETYIVNKQSASGLRSLAKKLNQ